MDSRHDSIHGMPHWVDSRHRLHRQTAQPGQALSGWTEGAGKPWKRIHGLLLVLVAVAACTGCRKKSPTAGGPGAMAIQVVAVEARRQALSETLSLPGTVTANEMVEIKCETEGIVQEINFAEQAEAK